MAIFDYNLTAGDVKDKAPIDTRYIGASSEPVSDGNITTWIEEGASEFSGLLEKAGLDGSDLADESLNQIQRGILFYAVSELLSKLGHTGQNYQQARGKYEDARQRYEDRPELLDRSISRVQSNVDTSKDDSDFRSINYQF